MFNSQIYTGVKGKYILAVAPLLLAFLIAGCSVRDADDIVEDAKPGETGDEEVNGEVWVTWEEDIQITDNGTGSLYPAVAAGSGKVHLCWVDMRHGAETREIYYRSGNGCSKAWQTEETRISDYASLSIRPSFAVSEDKILLFWRDDRHGNFEIYFVKSDDFGESWGVETRLTDNPGLSGCPFPAVSGDTLHLFWRDDRLDTFKIFYKRSDDLGENWTADTLLTPDGIKAEFPNPAVNEDTVHLVWRDCRHGNAEIYYKRSPDGGETWTEDKRLTNHPGESEHPKLAVKGENLYLVWRDDRDGHYEVYFKRSKDGGKTWSDDARLTFKQNQALWPVLAVSNGILHLVWCCGETDGNQALYYMFSIDGGETWSRKERLAECVAPLNIMGTYPIKAADPYIHLAFTGNRTGSNEVFYKRGTVNEN